MVPSMSFGHHFKSRCFTTTILACSVVTSRALSVPVGTSLTSAPKYSSCTSPKFDQFSEKVLGNWQWKSSANEAIAIENVEEVMRSCGGAVQGIRELPSVAPEHQPTGEGGYYLNRANDGFVYFDEDGSYCYGPVNVDSDTDNTLWLSSLSFGKSRIVLWNENMSSGACKGLQVHRKSAGEPPVADPCLVLERQPGDIAWQEIVRCRMPSITQPWMTQRLKWEKSFLEEGNSDEQSVLGEPAEIQSWAGKVSLADDPVLKALVGDVTASVLLCAGGFCKKTNKAKAVLRQYSEVDGSLKSVAWLQGKSNTRPSRELLKDDIKI